MSIKYCKNCGSDELIESDGVLMCKKCHTRYPVHNNGNKLIIILTLICVLLIGVFSAFYGLKVTLKGSSKDRAFESGLKAMEDGSYNDAIKIYQDLGDDENAKNKIAVCEAIISLNNSITTKSEEEVVTAIKKITNNGEKVNVSYVSLENHHVKASTNVNSYSDIYSEEITNPNFSLYVPAENNGYSFSKWTCVDTYYKENKSYVTLLSNWSLFSYNISYELDGGTNNIDNPFKYTTETGTITLKAPTKEDYDFVSWTNKDGFVVTEIPKGSYGDIQLTANWKKKQIPYSFVNYNGDVLDQGFVDIGGVATYSGKIPTKEKTDMNYFEFIGWDKDPKSTHITSETVFVAQFKTEINSYVVSFKNYDGSILQTYSLRYGNKAYYSKETPLKPNSEDDLHFYTFKGWDKPLTNIYADTVFTAVYEEGNRYLATFYDGDNILQSSRFNEGEVPNFIGNTPTKDSGNGGYLYFKGWKQEIKPITKDVRYDAIFVPFEEVNALVVASKMLEGKPYQIVIPFNASEAIVEGANEIKQYYHLVTNKEIEIVSDNNFKFDEQSRYISIGNTSIYTKALKKANRNIDLSKETMNEDGFYLLTVDQTLLINAYNDRGLLYGAYQFIEDSLGVRFLTDYYTHIPELNEVNLYRYDKAFVPLFEQRAYLNGGIFFKNIDYCAHMRFNTDYCPLPKRLGGSTHWAVLPNQSHNMETILSKNGIDPYEHPEVYAHTGKGNTAVPSFYNKNTIDLCYSHGLNDDGSINEEISESAVKYISKILIDNYISRDKNSVYYMLGQSDVETMCPCEECKASSAKFKASGVMIRFANAIANEIQKYFDETNQSERELYICVFAYNYNIDAPLGDDGKIIDKTCIPNDRVIIKYAPYNSIFYYGLDDPKQGEKIANQVNQWDDVAKQLMAWTYHSDYNDCFWYYPGSQNIQKTMKVLNRMGCSYHFAQGNFFQSKIYKEDIDAYIFSKLCWNIDGDPTYYRNEFIKCMFGEEAYPYVVDFHDTMENVYSLMDTNNENLRFYSSAVKSADYWTDSITKRLVDDIENAKSTIEQSSSLTTEKKNQLLINTDIALLTARYMRLKELGNYKVYEKSYIKSYAENWISLALKYGIKRTGEAMQYSFDALRKTYCEE